MNDDRALLPRDRAEVAGLLRDARRAAPARAAELLDRVLTVLPESRAALRARISLLLREGDAAAADVLIARALLLRPGDARFRLLRAESLHHQGRSAEAARLIGTVLEQRAAHRKALRLAMTCAAALGNHEQAARFALRLFRTDPADPRAGRLLLGALLDAGALDHAEALLGSMPDPPATLHARLLLARGRRLDAANVLTGAVHHETARSAGERDELLRQAMSVLRASDPSGMRALLERIGPDDVRSRFEKGLIEMEQGRFAAAAAIFHRLHVARGARQAALHGLFVAAVIAGRPRLGGRVMGRLRRHGDGLDHRLMAECWRRGMLGRLIRRQQTAAAGADPAARSILGGLLERAQAVLERSRNGETSGTAATNRESAPAAGADTLVR